MPKEFRCRLSFMGMPEQEGTAVLQDQFLCFTSADGKSRTLINRSMMADATMTYKEDGTVELTNVAPG